MELTDLIVQLNRESAKNTPDVYKKVMAKAKAEGLVKSNKKNTSQKTQTQSRKYDDYDYDYDYDYGYRGGSSSRGGSGIAKRIISWIVALAFIALSIFAVTYTIKIVIVKEGDGTENGGETPAPQTVPDGTSEGQTTVYYADGGSGYGVILENVD